MWPKPIVIPPISKTADLYMKTAIIVVDYQNDFMEGGALPITGALALLPTINLLLASAPDLSMAVFTQDQHPLKTDHFKKWPVHCVADSKGAELVDGLDKRHLNRFYIYKGLGTADDGYSGFEGVCVLTGMTLDELLTKCHVETIFLCGVATEYCVKATAMDAKRLGYTVFLVTNAIAGITDDGVVAALEEMQQAGIHMMEIH